MNRARVAMLGGLLLAATLPEASMAAEFKGCFARSYTGEHLASHPDQMVTHMRLALGSGGANQFLDNGFALEVKTRHLGDWHRAEGTCSGSGGEVLCTVPCHGFSGVAVRSEEGGSLLVDLEKPYGEIALTVCNGEPYATLDSGLDDKRFRLHPSACDW